MAAEPAPLRHASGGRFPRADENIDGVTGGYEAWEGREALSAVITLDEAAKNDFNLSPSRYVAVGGEGDVLPIEDAVVLLAEAEEERAEADRELRRVLGALGLE